MKRILNSEELISHGNIEGRKIVLDILEAGLQAADPYNNTFAAMRLDGDKLIIGGADFITEGDPQSEDEVIDLNEINRIYVFGAGKGIQRIAKAIEDVLGDRLTGGLVIAKHGDDLILDKIDVTFGAHPVPDEGCVIGCEKILEMASDLRKDDLVFTVVGNGVSSLLTMPVDGVSLEDVRQTTYLMQLERGAPTGDLNPIRNHLDQMKGGQLALHIQPARAIHIIATGLYSYDELMYANPFVHSLPDYTSFTDAVRLLKKWDAWEAVPASVRKYLSEANPAQETPKAIDFENMRYRIFEVMPDSLSMVKVARRKAIELGYTPYVIYDNFNMQAEANQVARVVSGMAYHSEMANEPFKTPCILIGHGELLVTIGSEQGMGGRNQEYALSAALLIADTQRIVMGSVDSDGTDGPGHQFVTGYDHIPVLTGAIVDGTTAKRAVELGFDLHEALKRHHTSPPLYELGDGIVATPNMSMGDLTITLIQSNQSS